MKFSRSDYNGRIIDLENKIPQDEPVMLLRGQDALAPRLVMNWASELLLNGGDPQLAEQAFQCARDMLEWQKTHVVKTPDSYKESGKMFYIREEINKIVGLIENNQQFPVSKLNMLVYQYCGREDMFHLLMPTDIKESSRSKDISQLTYDDFNISEDEAIHLFDCKLVVYITQSGRGRVLLNKLK